MSPSALILCAIANRRQWESSVPPHFCAGVAYDTQLAPQPSLSHTWSSSSLVLPLSAGRYVQSRRSVGMACGSRPVMWGILYIERDGKTTSASWESFN